MGNTCNTKTSKEAQVGEHSNDPIDPRKYIHAFADSLEEDCFKERSEVRARTRNTLASVSNAAVRITALALSACSTIVVLLVWGPTTAVAMQVGVVTAMVYAGTNDIRISVVEGNPHWRHRHRVLDRLVPQQPLD
ncbi:MULTISPECIES: hypothetical protein [unclassified Streptomyces]|uniref:hypothetical protein n=1 Tax=unclassified Streptomyces TaxID=2593676 RepID=UPI002E18A9D5|nr:MULTISPECIES: hypothetical protein [unclassified Streptomyces]